MTYGEDEPAGTCGGSRSLYWIRREGNKAILLFHFLLQTFLQRHGPSYFRHCNFMDEQDDASVAQPTSTRSRHSSRLGPYRQHIPETQFPLYHPVRTSSAPAAIYCRSLMSIGRGFPLWRPVPPSLPEAHLEQGFSIGDVGCLDRKGGFQYWFNIFYPRDHPVQNDVPRNFKPIEPPFSEWKTQVSVGDISPGSILSSQGIASTRISEQPLEVEFTSYAREGGVLVLSEGATREDLSEPDNLYPYLKEHVSDWYQFLNGYSDEPLLEPNVNSSLFVITGTDRAKTWSLAQFPPNHLASVTPTIFRYREDREQGRTFDTSYGASILSSHEKGSNAAGKLPSTFFIRGISTALSKPLWTHNIAPIPVHDLPIYCVPSVPAFGPRARLEAFVQRFRGSPDIKTRKEAIFHPAVVLLQILLEIAPAADIAIVEDSDWCPLMRGQSLLLAEFRDLVHRILSEKEITIKDGIALFVQKPTIAGKPDVKQKLQSYKQFLKTGSTKSTSERQALRKLNKILSKSRMTEDDDSNA